MLFHSYEDRRYFFITNRSYVHDCDLRLLVFVFIAGINFLEIGKILPKEKKSSQSNVATTTVVPAPHQSHRR